MSKYKIQIENAQRKYEDSNKYKTLHKSQFNISCDGNIRYIKATINFVMEKSPKTIKDGIGM